MQLNRSWTSYKQDLYGEADSPSPFYLQDPFKKTMNQAKHFNLFFKFYSLPHFKHREKINEEILHSYQKNRFFIVIVIYNQNKEILYLRNFSRNNGWELVGGFVDFQPKKSIIDVINRIAKKETNLLIDEILPIAKLTNIFRCNHQITKHQGIAFIARTRGNPKCQKDFQSVFSSEIPKNLIYSNKEIAKIALKKILNKNNNIYDHEIDSFRKNFIKYKIHNIIMGPILRLFSFPVRNFIFKNITLAKSVIDVSSGDDDLIAHIAARYNSICCSNDISWKSLGRVQKRSRNISNIFFTNQDVTNLSFKRKFDVAICKNTLHHMHSQKEKYNLLKSLSNISKKIIVIDINDPLNSGFWARFWHKYYLFLGDQGDSFITEKEFKDIINNFFRDSKKHFSTIITPKGKYLATVIDLN